MLIVAEEVSASDAELVAMRKTAQQVFDKKEVKKEEVVDEKKRKFDGSDDAAVMMTTPATPTTTTPSNCRILRPLKKRPHRDSWLLKTTPALALVTSRILVGPLDRRKRVPEATAV
jgi:hypothetical protein